MVAAVRQKGTPMVTPAVVHWRENHYAAVIAEQDGQYLVQDPTFLTAEWIDGATLEAEASGYFLIPAYRLMAGWRSVPAGEAAQVFGQGYPQAQCDDCPPPHEGDCCEVWDGDLEGSGTQHQPKAAGYPDVLHGRLWPRLHVEAAMGAALELVTFDRPQPF
jgi:hypothetical protein